MEQNSDKNIKFEESFGEHYQSVLEASNDAVVVINAEGLVLSWNRSAEEMLGYGDGELAGKRISAIIPDLSTDDSGFLRIAGSAQNSQIAGRRIQTKGVHKSGRSFPAELSFSSYNVGGLIHHTLIICDIVDRLEREAFIKDALRLAKSPSRKEYLDSVVKIIKNWSGCSCVGIRILDPDGTMPFESHVGFSEEFWKWENWLSIKHDCCICIRIITENTEPQDAPITTEDGSFRTDNMRRFLDGLPVCDRERFRGNCPKYGYLSIAFVPIQYRGKVFGGIHLADERDGMIPLGKVEFIESIAMLIGEAIYRLNIEEDLRKSEAELKKALEAMERFNEELVEKVKERTKELEEAKRAAEELSLLDGLTGIANRRRFDEYLNQEIRRAARSKKPLSLIMLDIDFFKLFNDHYGHIAGDDCLKEVAHVLAKTLNRSTDMIARYGGEEFACILTETDAEGALAVAKDFLEAIRALRIRHDYSPAGNQVTLSCGIVTVVPAFNTSPTEIIKQADAMLYQAKGGGRNQIRHVEIK